jgi:hypothetical protein
MVIAKQELYTIEVNPKKNRMYITLRGTWICRDDVPDYLLHIRKAVEVLSPGFSVLADVSEMGEPTVFSMAIHKVAQRSVVNRGLKRTAEVFPPESSIEKALHRISASSSMVRRSFHSIEKAEKWLDFGIIDEE